MTIRNFGIKVMIRCYPWHQAKSFNLVLTVVLSNDYRKTIGGLNIISHKMQNVEIALFISQNPSMTLYGRYKDISLTEYVEKSKSFPLLKGSEKREKATPPYYFQLIHLDAENSNYLKTLLDTGQ